MNYFKNSRQSSLDFHVFLKKFCGQCLVWDRSITQALKISTKTILKEAFGPT